MIVAAISAAVMKNTTTTAMFVPVVLGLATRARIAPSKLLMPLAFGAILGGTSTLIGTSTNLAVSGAITRYGLQPYSMFELAWVGVPIVAVGMLYMLLLGVRLLPRRGGEESLTDQYHIREYLSEVIVMDDSPLVGKTLAEANLSNDLDLTVVGIVRGKEGRIAPSAHEIIRGHDSLLVQGKIEDILRVKSEAGIEIKPDFKLSDDLLESEEVELFEVMVLRGSDFIGRTLRGLRFRQRYGLTVLAVNRHGVALMTKLSNISLRFGDVLLVQGKREELEHLIADGNLLLLEDVSERQGRHGKRRWALIAFGVFLLFSITHPPQVPLAVAVLVGALILLASKAVRVQEMYGLIEWRLIILIAGMISFGTAMEKTGADRYLANLIVRGVGDYGSLAVLAGFFVLTVVLTQPMSNQAAALVVVPIAIQTAASLGLNPRTFAVMVTYAASCSFLTPLEPACVLIFTPGRYRFFDFVKVGSLLTVAVFAIVMLLVPVYWPIQQTADLSVAQSASPNPVAVGQSLTYTISVANNGPDTAQSIKVKSELPASLAFATCSASGGGICKGEGNNRLIEVSSLAAGATVTVSITALVNDTVKSGDIIDNTVSVESPTGDSDRNDTTVKESVRVSE
jgi:uncharacterized repeat protein (TIGR01451 family)